MYCSRNFLFTRKQGQLRGISSHFRQLERRINPLFHVEKWPNILLKSRGVNTARFLKYVWPFFNIMK